MAYDNPPTRRHWHPQTDIRVRLLLRSLLLRCAGQIRRLVGFAIALGVGAMAVQSQPILRVPSGFTIRRVAEAPAIRFPMFAALDDQRRLYVTESSGGDLYAELRELVRHCRIRRLEDRDRNGQYETSSVFAEDLTPSMGLVWRDGKLFAADPPDLVALQDTDGDGHADQRTVVLTGFGHTDNGSLHGLTFGPDGWLYFTMGDPDSYELRGPDGSLAQGTTGALIRCRPDGSRVETVSRGFDNLVEIVFLPDGSIIGTLNWYQFPENGARDALVQLLEGSQFPRHAVDRKVPHLQFNAVLPPLALFSAVALSGLEIYRDAAFPSEMRGNLFSAQHNARKIVRHQLTPKGASYAVTTFDFVTTDDPDVHFSDVLEDADGSLLIVDTGSWYVQHCPTGRIRRSPAAGAIYRVSTESTDRQKHIANFANSKVRSPNWSERTDLRAALRGGDVATVAAAARAAGRRGETNASPELVALLRSTDLGLRLAAAEALAHCGNAATAAALLEVLAADTDAFVEHALIFALHRLGDAQTLRSALEHPSPKVQRAVLLLLDQPPIQAATERSVIARLNASDARLRDMARWVLTRHPEWGEAGAAFLQELVERPNPTSADRQALRQLLPLFQTNANVVAALARTLAPANPTATGEQRARLLDALSILDLRHVPEVLAAPVLQGITQGDPAVRLSAIRAASALRLAGTDDALAQLADDPAQPDALRLEARRELVRHRPSLDAAGMNFLIRQLDAGNTPATRLSAAETLTQARLSAEQWTVLLRAVRGDSLVSPSSVLSAVQRNGLPAKSAVAMLDYVAASLDAGWTIPSELLETIGASVPAAQRGRAEQLLARLTESVERQREQLARFEPRLQGGDPVRGQKIFFEKAQCVACHRVSENGGRVGPDLTRIGGIRAGRDLLESIVVPSSTIAQGYDTFVATLKDGESYTGVRVGSNDGPLVLRLASGAEMTIHAREIERLERSKLSLMPEGLLNNLTGEEVRDLLAYLQQLK